MNEKYSGYTLLGVGLAVMCGAMLWAILIFVGRMEPIPIIHIPAPTLDTSTLIPKLPLGLTPKGTTIELIQTAGLNKMLNLGLTLLLTGILISFGHKLADLGVKLVRPIVIEAKTVK